MESSNSALFGSAGAAPPPKAPAADDRSTRKFAAFSSNIRHVDILPKLFKLGEMCSFARNQIVTVIVGSDEQEFGVHEYRLKEESEYFAKAFSEHRQLYLPHKTAVKL